MNRKMKSTSSIDKYQEQDLHCLCKINNKIKHFLYSINKSSKSNLTVKQTSKRMFYARKC